MFGQAVNRLFAQQATEEQTTGEHEKDKCQEGHRFEQSLKTTRLLFHGQKQFPSDLRKYMGKLRSITRSVVS